MFNNLKYLFLVLLSLELLFSCKNNAPTTSKKEYILWSNSFEGNKMESTESLQALIPFSQKANARPLNLPISPRVWWYNFGQNRFNAQKQQEKLKKIGHKLEALKNSPEPSINKIQRMETKLGKVKENIEEGNSWFWRNIGQKQVYVSENAVIETSKKIKKKLFDDGFRDATVGYKLDTIIFTNKVKVIYKINENTPYVIDTVQYVNDNPKIDSILNANVDKQFLSKGKFFNTSLAEAEKNRIELLLKQNGFYQFNSKYIKQLATNKEQDEAIFKKEKHGILRFEILNPIDDKKHEQFTISEIIFKAFDPSNKKNDTKPDTTLYKGINFIRIDKRIPLRLVRSRIITQPNTIYNISQVNETQRQIGYFNQFAFASTQVSVLGKDKIRLEYFAPLLEKYTLGISPGINNIYSDGYTFFGFGLPVTLSSRNNFRKLETIEASLTASYEGQPTPIIISNKPIRGSKELSGNINFTFPQFLGLNNIFTKYNLKNPRTILGVGYTYSEPFWGKRLNFRTRINYSIQLSKFSSLYFSPLDINLINTIYADNENGQLFYDKLVALQNLGNNLKVTFDPQFVSSFNFNYVYNNQNLSKPFSSSKFFRLFVESGGTLMNINNSSKVGIIEKIFPYKSTADAAERAYFKFVKINADYRRTININKNSSYAYRLNLGVANPYAKNHAMPYDKNFFIGGSNSVRAWSPRTLGAGSAAPDTVGGNTIPEPGDILLESSIEYRLKVAHFIGDIQIAGFVDAGNVWKWHQINTEAKYDKANFDFSRFYKEIAVGTGLGLRWDLSYFLFRFDWGIKVVDPSRNVGDRWVLDQFSIKKKQFYGLNWNFGIGYPF